MTPATNNRNAQAFWEAVYLAHSPGNCPPRQEYIFCKMHADKALALWLYRFGTPEERVQFEEWQQAQDAGNEAEAGA